MTDAATNVQVRFGPHNTLGGDEDAAANVQPSVDSAVPVVRPDVPAALSEPAMSEPRSGEWEEPALPEVDEIEGAGAVPSVAIPAVTDLVAGDERPTAEQPAVVDELEAPASMPEEPEAPSAPSAPSVPAVPAPAAQVNAPQAPPAQASAPSAVPVPQQVQPTQPWQAPQQGHQPQMTPFQPNFGPHQGAGQFQGQHNSGQVQRPPTPQPFGQPGAPVQGAPQHQPQYQQAPMRPMGESLSAPMSTASSSFNQQIRFSDAAVRVSGWRAWLKKMGMDVGPSANEQEHAELVHRIRVPKHKFHVTSVFADNAGGTLLVGVLGQILERTRADNVVALDLDPDGGDLDQVTAWHQGGSTARTLIQQSDLSDRNQVDKHLAVTSTNLHVLPSPWRFNGRDVPDYDDVLDLYSIFRPHYSLALVDAGRGLQTLTGTGVLEISSALILPASATTRGVRKVAATIDWLRHHGWHGLLANTIVVINHTKRRSSVSVEQFDELFRAGQKLRVHEIPYDPHLDADVPIDLDLMRKRTIRAFEELAADLADGFNSGYEPPAAQKLAELQQVRSNDGR